MPWFVEYFGTPTGLWLFIGFPHMEDIFPFNRSEVSTGEILPPAALLYKHCLAWWQYATKYKWGLFNIKNTSCQYKNFHYVGFTARFTNSNVPSKKYCIFHCGDKTIWSSFYLHNEISDSSATAFLFFETGPKSPKFSFQWRENFCDDDTASWNWDDSHILYSI